MIVGRIPMTIYISYPRTLLSTSVSSFKPNHYYFFISLWKAVYKAAVTVAAAAYFFAFTLFLILTWYYRNVRNVLLTLDFLGLVLLTSSLPRRLPPLCTVVIMLLMYDQFSLLGRSLIIYISIYILFFVLWYITFEGIFNSRSTLEEK